MEKKSIGSKILSRMLGFFIFLVLLGIAKVLSFYIASDFYSAIIGFFIDNLFLSLIIFFITLIGDIFWGLFFPFNLPAPIISAVASIFIVNYIYKLLVFIDSYALMGINFSLGFITQIVFWIVLVVGYIVIIVRLFGWDKIKYEWKERKEEKEDEDKKKKSRKKKRR